MATEWYQQKGTYATGSAIIGGTSGVLSSIFSYQQAKAQSKLLLAQAKTQEKVASTNIDKIHKKAGLQLRILENERISAEANTAAAVAAAGIMQGSQTAQELQRQNDRVIAQEQWAIRQQAIEETMSLQLESRLNTISLQHEAAVAKAAGKANLFSGLLGATNSVLSSAALAAS